MTKEEFSLLFHRAKVNLVAFKMLYEPEAFEAMQRMVEMAVAEEREVLKLALEALEKIAAYRPLTFAECSDAEAVIGIAENAIPVLRKALAQPEQEPVAWMDEYGDVLSASVVDGSGLRNIPLYTAPPQRGGVRAVPDFILEKFAELIVRECLDKIETHRIPVGNSAAGEMACEWTYDALKEIRDEIKEHFGVEE